MTMPCFKWKDRLLEAALGEVPGGALAEHLKNCPACASALTELHARRAQLDSCLTLVARGAELPGDFRARVLAAVATAQPSRTWPWRRWVPAAAALAVILLVAVIGWRRGPAGKPRDAEFVSVEALMQWRAPSDVFLETPGREILQTIPKLGTSHLDSVIPRNEEE